jgi:hypothetical protein
MEAAGEYWSWRQPYMRNRIVHARKIIIGERRQVLVTYSLRPTVTDVL